MNPNFLTVADVLDLHDLSLRRYGGLSGVRDRGLLESAVGHPQASFDGEFLYEGPIAVACAYQVSIIKNHPFVDGNKRAGLASALAFLELNGVSIDRSTPLLYDATMAVAESRLSREGMAEVLNKLINRPGSTIDPSQP